MNVVSVEAHSSLRDTEIATSVLEGFLAGVPTAIGRLVWIASFRLQGSDEYRHPAIDQLVPRPAASEILKDSHDSLFGHWLSLGLREQHTDLVEYFELHPSAARSELWRDTFENLIPASAQRAERLLFETDLAVVLELEDCRQ